MADLLVHKTARTVALDVADEQICDGAQLALHLVGVDQEVVPGAFICVERRAAGRELGPWLRRLSLIVPTRRRTASLAASAP